MKTGIPREHHHVEEEHWREIGRREMYRTAKPLRRLLFILVSGVLLAFLWEMEWAVQVKKDLFSHPMPAAAVKKRYEYQKHMQAFESFNGSFLEQTIHNQSIFIY